MGMKEKELPILFGKNHLKTLCLWEKRNEGKGLGGLIILDIQTILPCLRMSIDFVSEIG